MGLTVLWHPLGVTEGGFSLVSIDVKCLFLVFRVNKNYIYPKTNFLNAKNSRNRTFVLKQFLSVLKSRARIMKMAIISHLWPHPPLNFLTSIVDLDRLSNP